MRHVALLLVLLVVGTRAALAEDALPEGPRAHDPGAAAWRVLEARCAACHDGSRGPAKGELDHVLDLERLGREARFVLPHAPQHSPLLQQVLAGRMPPPDSGHAPPTPDEVAILRAWIQSGAQRGAAPPPPELPAARDAGAARLLGSLHPLTVHFPIVLLIGAALLEVVFALRPVPILERAGRIGLALGALSALAASGTGWLWAAATGHGADAHRWLAVGVTLCAAGTTLLAPRGTAEAAGAPRGLYRVALGLTLALVVLAGHQGGLLTHGAPRFLP
jgi:uncharacterized membrane protein